MGVDHNLTMRLQGTTMTSGRVLKFISLAAEEAEKSEVSIKHGAVVARGNRLLGGGHNSDRSRYSMTPNSRSTNHVSMHAECSALRRSMRSCVLLRSLRSQ